MKIIKIYKIPYNSSQLESSNGFFMGQDLGGTGGHGAPQGSKPWTLGIHEIL
jgi:hypothetical protein